MISIIPKERFEREVEVYQDGIHIGNISTEGQVRYLQVQCLYNGISIELRHDGKTYIIDTKGMLSEVIEELCSIDAKLTMLLYPSEGVWDILNPDLRIVKEIDEFLQTDNELENLYKEYRNEKQNM